MRRVPAVALGLLAYLAVPFAWADKPSAVISGPEAVVTGQMIVLDARASVSDKPLAWKLAGPDAPLVLTTPDGAVPRSLALVFSARAGVYRFTLIAKGTPPGGNEIDADAAIWVVTVSDPPPPTPVPVPVPVPTPPAPPNPTPPIIPPAPEPVAGHLHVSYVVDVDAITVSQAVVREGVAVRPALAALDASYRTYPATSSDLTRLNLATVVAKAGTPCLIVQDAGGKVLSAEVAPASEAEVVAKIKAYRGATR